MKVNNNGFVVTVGGANTELILESDIRLDEKHVVPEDKRRDTVGGSSLNHTCRLLAMGQPVIPILPIAQDERGDRIVNAIKLAAEKGGIDPPDVRRIDGEHTTPHTTIIVGSNRQRTLFNEPTDAIDLFERQVKECLENIDGKTVHAIMIGHIHADAASKCRITRSVIERFRGKGSYIFVNPGSSQYKQGADLLNDLHGADCIQLNKKETQLFHKASSVKCASDQLKELLCWLSEKAKLSIITLGHVGAVAKRKNEDEICVAWPYDLRAVGKDSTGAGDAFGAGIVWTELNMGTTDSSLVDRLAVSRLWAAYGCKTPGGADDCPNQKELAKFEKECDANGLAIRKVESLKTEESEFFLQLLQLLRQ